MSQVELTERISDRLQKQIAFGGLLKRKTVEGEIILKCPQLACGEGDLEPLASDLTQIMLDYIEEAGAEQIKAIIKNILAE